MAVEALAPALAQNSKLVREAKCQVCDWIVAAIPSQTCRQGGCGADGNPSQTSRTSPDGPGRCQICRALGRRGWGITRCVTTPKWCGCLVFVDQYKLRYFLDRDGNIARPRVSTDPRRPSSATTSNSLPDTRRLLDDRAGTGRISVGSILLASTAVNAVLIFWDMEHSISFPLKDKVIIRFSCGARRWVGLIRLWGAKPDSLARTRQDPVGRGAGDCATKCCPGCQCHQIWNLDLLLLLVLVCNMSGNAFPEAQGAYPPTVNRVTCLLVARKPSHWSCLGWRRLPYCVLADPFIADPRGT